jgi:hypothetical protein
VKEIQVKLKTILTSSVASAALFAVAAPAISTSAVAGVSNGNDNGLVFSGQISRSIVRLDDGTNEEVFHVDGGSTGSRFRFAVTGSLTDSLSVGALYETGLTVSNAIGTMSMEGAFTGGNGAETIAGAALDQRQGYISFSHKAAGKLTIGELTQPNNNTKTAWGGSQFSLEGLSHTGVTEFRNNADGATGNVTAAGQFGSFGGGRTDGIRYDLPSGLPVSAAIALENGGSISAGVTYAAPEMAGITATFGGAYVNASAESATVDSNQNVSAALKHASGLGVAIGRGWEDTNASATVTDGQNTWVGVSYQTTALSSLGSSHFRITYAESEDMTTEGDSGEKLGIQFVQNLPAGTSVHMGWEESEYESTTIKTYDDVTSFIAGALIKF